MSTRNYSATIHDRLAASLQEQPNGCITWMGARFSSGYGRIARGARGAGVATTHRAAWEVTHGPIPEGMCVLHKCDNPPCCNVDHLFLGTLSDNTQDMMRKGRHRGQMPAGAAHPSAKLTDAEVSSLRSIAPRVGNYAELGRMFGISKQHARMLCLDRKRTA